MTARFRKSVIASYPFAGSERLFYAPLRGVGAALPARAADLLEHCAAFRTLDEHAAVLEGAQRGADRLGRAQIRRALDELAGGGFLVSDAELLGALRGADAGPDEGARVGAVAVPSRGRPAALGRLLEALTAQARARGHAPRVIVALSGEGEEAARRELAARQGDYGGEIRVADRASRARHLEALAARGVAPAELLAFALRGVDGLPGDYGANRNVLLLETAGELCVGLDDDVLPTSVGRRGAPGGVAFAGRPVQMHMFAERAELAAFAEPADVAALAQEGAGGADLLGEHEAFLGCSAAACARREGAVEPGAMSDRLLGLLLRGRGRVVLTASALFGDSGCAFPTAALFLDGAERARLVRDEAHYRQALVSRLVFKGPERTTVSDDDFLQTGAYGYDARLPLPPFFPALRGEDTLFGMATRLAHPDGLTAYLARAVTHAPIESRRHPEGQWLENYRRPSLEITLQLALEAASLSFALRDPRLRLDLLGAHLEGLGALPDDDFAEWVQLASLRRVGMHLTAIEALLARFDGAPRYWADDARAAAATMRETMAAADYAHPSELRDAGFDRAAAVRQTKRLVRDYGTLVRLWPDVVAASAELARAGLGPSRPVT